MQCSSSAPNEQPYICFASNQPLPNLTPLVGGHLRPRAIHIVTPPERRQYATWFERAVSVSLPQTPVHIEPIDDAYDLQQTRALLQRLAATHPQGCTVNITGGSKLLTLAAWEALRRDVDRIFYVRPSDDSLAWLHPQAGATPIADQLTLRQWLLAYGWEVHPDLPPNRPDAKSLALDAQHHGKRTRQIAEAYQHRRIGVAKDLSTDDGRWLEEYLAYALTQLFADDASRRARLHDVSGPFKVFHTTNARVVNEIDGAVLYNNRLTVFEAKVGAAAEGASAADAIYKLSRLRDQLGGWISQGVFVSARRVSEDLKARGRQYGVTVIDALELPQLRAAIEAVLQRPNAI